METINKNIIDAGLITFYPVVVLSDENSEVIMDRDDYSYMRINEGMTDREIFNFAGAGVV